MDKYFLTYQEAEQFAKERQISRAPINPGPIPENLEMFNIEGYSRAVYAFYFQQYIYHEANVWEYVAAIPAVQLVETGKVFRIVTQMSYRPIKYCLFEFPPINIRRCLNYEPPINRPKYIGKVTKSKIQAWVDYVEQVNNMKRDYVEKALQANIDFVERFKAKYPAGDYNTQDDGWTSEFEIKVDAYRIHYSALEDGSFHRNFDLDYWKLPTNEDLLGEYASSIIPCMIFDSKDKANRLDNIIQKFLSENKAQQEFRKVKYASAHAALRAIEINEFHLKLKGPYSDELISACEDVDEILDGDTVEDCYRSVMNYLYLKIGR